MGLLNLSVTTDAAPILSNISVTNTCSVQCNVIEAAEINFVSASIQKHAKANWFFFNMQGFNGGIVNSIERLHPSELFNVVVWEE